MVSCRHQTRHTKLINQETHRAVESSGVLTRNQGQIIAEQIIPENEGGFWIREIGFMMMKA